MNEIKLPRYNIEIRHVDGGTIWKAIEAEKGDFYLVKEVEASRSRAASEPGEVSRLAEDVRLKTLETAARACEKLAEERFNDHGTREPDTGACYYGGRVEEEYQTRDEEDDECAQAIRALASMATSPASEAQAGLPIGWICERTALVKLRDKLDGLPLHAHKRVVVRAWIDEAIAETEAQAREALPAAQDRCSHGIRHPHECRECADAEYPAAPQPASSPVAAEGQKAVKWGYAKTVGNAIAQLQTKDPALPFYAALHLQDGRCIARGVTFSRERVINERWIDNTNKDVPYSLVVWSQPVQSLFATPTASMADAAEATPDESDHPLHRCCDCPACTAYFADNQINNSDGAIYATSGPRGENAGGVVEVLSEAACEKLGLEHESGGAGSVASDGGYSSHFFSYPDFAAFCAAIQRACATAWGLRIAEKGDAS